MASGEFLTEVQDDDEVQEYNENNSHHGGSQLSEDQEDGHTDTDADDSDVDAQGPRTSKEKKRFQYQIFRSFAAQQTEKITEKEVKEAIKNTNDDNLSIRDILAKQETSASISPRDYQTELFRKAKDENIIAVLDTGSGKTHIATLLLRHILDIELEARARRGPHKIAFFLVRVFFQRLTYL
jgi:endoribonuclease Dicer